jgi:hypothetical protein
VGVIFTQLCWLKFWIIFHVLLTSATAGFTVWIADTLIHLWKRKHAMHKVTTN